MRQFVYISTAAPHLDQPDITKILEVSLRNNIKREITGFLLFNGRNFLQLVEGPEGSLLALMADLYRDPRHSGIVRLEDNAITARACEKWIMKRLMMADSVSARKAGLEPLLPKGLTDQVRRNILNFASLN